MTTAGRAGGQIPVHILTGFLGSGKTTLLRRLLEDEDFKDTAVLINEFGEAGLDHLIAREVSEDVLLLDSGCLCCSVGDDLASTFLDLLDMRREGEAEFERVVIETSGLADPGPIIQLVMTDARIRKHFRMGRVIAAVDGINGSETLERYLEAQHQIGLADAVIVTKQDIVPSDRVESIWRQVSALNGALTLIERDEISEILIEEKAEETPALRPATHLHHETGNHHVHGHSEGVASFVVSLPERIDRTRFVHWLQLLLQARGKSILRVKGLLSLDNEERPYVLQAVQTIVFPLTHLEHWPEGEPRAQLVFICKEITKAAIERSLREHVIGHNASA